MNCTDRLLPLDISVSKAAKEFLRSKFQKWNADKVTIDGSGHHDGHSGCSLQPVDLKLKPIGAR